MAQTGCRHVHRPPGLHRVAGTRAEWVDAAGDPVSDAATLTRLAHLALPPAWTDVWAAPDGDSRVQATGIDSRGRTQYRYSEAALEASARNKYAHTLAFAQALPVLRQQVVADLEQTGIPPLRVTAGVVRLLDLGMFRVGNAKYTRDNHTHGLTTLERQHVAMSGDTLVFDFVGKEHKDRHVQVTDAAAAAVVRDLLAVRRRKDERLFVTGVRGAEHYVDSASVNAYVHAHGDVAASAKVFRTWGGTVVAACVAAGAELPELPARRDPDLMAIDAAAHLLGNTRAVARRSYVHPAAFDVGRSDAVRGAVGAASRARGSTDVRDLFHDPAVQHAVMVGLEERAEPA